MSAAAGKDALAALFESLASGGGEVVRRKMFGYPSAFLGGYLCFCLHERGLVLRLPQERRAALLAAGTVSEFTPRAGRTMKNFVAVEEPLSRNRSELAALVGEAVAHAAGLPPKPPRKARRG